MCNDVIGASILTHCAQQCVYKRSVLTVAAIVPARVQDEIRPNRLRR
jgi:hypothetical protein